MSGGPQRERRLRSAAEVDVRCNEVPANGDAACPNLIADLAAQCVSHRSAHQIGDLQRPAGRLRAGPTVTRGAAPGDAGGSARRIPGERDRITRIAERVARCQGDGLRGNARHRDLTGVAGIQQRLQRFIAGGTGPIGRRGPDPGQGREQSGDGAGRRSGRRYDGAGAGGVLAARELRQARATDHLIVRTKER